MSELYRKVSSRMWADRDFQNLSRPQPNAQSLWQYLITGLHTNPIPGLFAAHQEELARKLRWEIEGFREALAELLPEGCSESSPEAFRKRWLEADWESGVVWIENGFFHNEPQSPNVIRGWKQHAALIPECDLKDKALQRLRELCYAKGKPFGKAFDETFHKSSRKASRKTWAISGAGAGAGEEERASAPPEAAPPSETQTHEKPVAIEPREVTRFRQPLEDAVRAQFFARRATPQKASPQQWRDGCQTVQDALDLKAYPSADRAIEEFAKRIVDACARGERLGFALQQVPLAEPVKPADAPALSSITADGRTKHVW